MGWVNASTHDNDADEDQWTPLPIGTTRGIMNDKALQSLVLQILSGLPHKESSSGDLHDRPVQFSTKLRPMDILCGRSNKQMELHAGNRYYRSLVAVHKEKYKRYHRQSDKTILVDDLLTEVFSIGGRFVEKKVLQRNGRLKAYSDRLHSRSKLEDGEKIVYASVDYTTVVNKLRRALRREDRIVEHE